MRIPLLVRGRAKHVSSADRLFRFRQVLKSAQRTPFYSHSLSCAGLDTSSSLRSLRSVEETLQRLPILSEHSEMPRPRRTRCLSAASLYNPLPETPAITLASQAANTRPAILAGSFQSLMALAGVVPVERGLIVLTGVMEGGFSTSDRDRLWSAFGLPMFEQHVGLDGQVAAHECEAHEGLHIVHGNAILESQPEGDLILTSLTDLEQPTLRLRTGFSGRVRNTECACGSSEARIVDLVFSR